MKKIFKMALNCFVVLMLVTGCAMKTNYGINISRDKKVKLDFIIAMDNDYIDGLMNMQGGLSFVDEEEEEDSEEEKAYTDAERWAYLEENFSYGEEYTEYTKTKYDKDGYKGYEFTLDLGDIDNLVAESKDKIDFEDIKKDSKIFTKDGEVYSLNLKLSESNLDQLKQYMQMVKFDLKLKVTLPYKAKSNNATEVSKDKLTYTWDLTKTNSIDLSFEFKPSNNIVHIVIIAAAVLAVGAVIFVVVKKSKSKVTTQTNQ